MYLIFCFEKMCLRRNKFPKVWLTSVLLLSLKSYSLWDGNPVSLFKIYLYSARSSPFTRTNSGQISRAYYYHYYHYHYYHSTYSLSIMAMWRWALGLSSSSLPHVSLGLVNHIQFWKFLGLMSTSNMLEDIKVDGQNNFNGTHIHWSKDKTVLIIKLLFLLLLFRIVPLSNV